MDIYSLIRQDHRRVAELFEQLEASEDIAERTALFEQLKRELTLHKEGEERTFYAALSTLLEIADRIEESLEEHVDIEELLQQLGETDIGSDAFAGQLAELREEVEHHVGEEENEIFPRARKLLTEEQATTIAREMEAEKQRLGA